MATFENPRDPDNIELKKTLSKLIQGKWRFAEEIEVTEINCSDPGCMDKETLIKFKDKANKAYHYRIHKPIVFIRKPDIDNLQEINLTN